VREGSLIAPALECAAGAPIALNLEEADLIGIEESGEFCERDISRSLAENGPACAGVKHAMVRYRQGLALATR
jgi:hypothetical protein